LEPGQQVEQEHSGCVGDDLIDISSGGRCWRVKSFFFGGGEVHTPRGMVDNSLARRVAGVRFRELQTRTPKQVVCLYCMVDKCEYGLV